MSGRRTIRIAAIGVAAAAIIALAASANAQQRGSRETRDFVAEAGQTDVFEMMEAASALAASQDPAVIAFAEQMMRDHAGTTAALRQATTQAGLEPPPTQMSAGQAALLAALQSARGQAFDRLYWHQQALAHRAALVVQQRYAATGDTPAIRQAAMQAVPVIQQHLATAERMMAANPER